MLRLILIFFVLGLVLHFSAEAQTGPDVLKEPNWTTLFDRDSGWTGSDAVYSVPFSGFDAPGGDDDDSTMFLFGDTFIGEVDENNNRQDSKLIRNTIGVLNTKEPIEDEIQFYWETDSQGEPEALFKADTPESDPDDWIWPMDGIRLGKRFYIYGLRLFDPPGLASFEINGVTLISFELDSTNQIINWRHVDTPLFHKNDEDVEIVIGQAVMPMTDASGNPGPDGYLYIYGPRNRPLQVKQMVVARVQPQHIEQFDRYEYWDGNTWQEHIEECAVITDSISQEFSVTPLNDGTFIAVFEFDSWVCVRYGESVTGPFDEVQYIYECPEDTMYKSAYVYNAKAHPHLSEAGDLLISYNVNTSDYNELYQNADTYRPRFIRYYLPGDPSELENESSPPGGRNPVLQPNYPNPFNGETRIPFSIERRAFVHIAVYNATGQRVATLLQRRMDAGRHQVRFDGRDFRGRTLPAGVYYISLKCGSHTRVRKMVFLK